MLQGVKEVGCGCELSVLNTFFCEFVNMNTVYTK